MEARQYEEQLEALELDLLLEALSRQYGIDLRGYDPHHLRRQIWTAAVGERVGSLSGLQERVLHEPAAVERLLAEVWVPTTAMFRDPRFFRTLAETVFPMSKGPDARHR